MATGSPGCRGHSRPGTTLLLVSVSEATIREAGAGDIEEIVDVCSAALGWEDPDWDRRLFAWKHSANAFGPSLVLVAEDHTGILAVRPLMMWRFASKEGTVRAARAVDTAVRPDAQGRGLFRKLTEFGLDHLKRQGVAFIFNTPNEQSKPGYLKMGWHDAGRVEFGIRVQRARAVPKVLRSKVAAEKPSIPTPGLGVDPRQFLASLPEIPKRIGDRWQTDHDRATLAWRFVDGPVSYRALPMGDSGGAIVRVRQRGLARELLVAEQIGDVPERLERQVLWQAMDDVDADHLIRASRTPGTISTDRVGPGLTMRQVAVFHPDPADMAWAPGDLELF